jgi:homoserine kinase type II
VTPVVPLVADAASRVWRVDTADGRYAVTQLFDVDPLTAHQFHQVREVLAASGLPVPPPLRTAAGRTLLEVEGGLYAAAPWLDGEMLAAREWDEPRTRQVGELLGNLHSSLAEAFPGATAPVTPPIPEAATAKAAVDRHADRLARSGEETQVEMNARRLLDARHVRLENQSHLRPADGLVFTAAGRTHGVLREYHTRFGPGGAVTALHGWRRVAARAHAEEFALTATSLFGWIDAEAGAAVFDTARIGAFARGYRTVRGVESDQVLAAARLVWWRRLCDFDRLDRFADSRDETELRHWVTESALVLTWSEQREAIESALLAG